MVSLTEEMFEKLIIIVEFLYNKLSDFIGTKGNYLISDIIKTLNMLRFYTQTQKQSFVSTANSKEETIERNHIVKAAKTLEIVYNLSKESKENV